jgi:polysaccharide export outer membrane protein
MKVWQSGVLVIVLGLTIVAFGCSHQINPVLQAQAAAAEVSAPDQERYRLGPEDVIEVSVWKEPDMTKTLIVQPDGKIFYPLIGEVRAVGKTVKELQEEISKRLEKFVTDAAVTVILLKTQHYKFFVTGKVNKPGEYLAGRPVSVLQAIAIAGGLTPFASPKNIKIVRKRGNIDEVYPFNYKEVSKGLLMSQDIYLEPGDVVVVP